MGQIADGETPRYALLDGVAFCAMPKAAWSSLRAACVDSGGTSALGIPAVERRISVVRHPYDRARSWWQDQRAAHSCSDIALELYRSNDTFDIHWASQSWLVDIYGATEIWRYENLQEHWAAFRPDIALPHRNAARRHRHGIEYVLDETAKTLIHRRYISDFKRFGYDP